MTILGRAGLDHPTLGQTPKEDVYAAIETIYTNISNDLSGRYYAVGPATNGSTTVLDHGFGVDLSELSVKVYTGSAPNLTRVTTGFSWVATPGNLKTQLSVTAPGVGGPHTFVVWITHGNDAEKLADLNDVSDTTGLDGQLLIYNTTNSQWEPSHLYLKSETASIVTNTLTPAIGRPFQYLSGAITDLQMIGNPSPGKIMAVFNSTVFNLKVKNLTGLTAANQIITGTGQDFTLKSGSACLFLYSGEASKWILLGGGGGGGLVPRYVSFATYAATTLEFGFHYLIDTSGGAFTMALPVGANENVIRFSDFASTFDTNSFNLTTSQKIATQAVGENFLMDTKDLSAELSYYTDRFVLITQLVSAGSSSVTTSSGGLNPIEVTSSPASPTNNTMYEVDLTTATVVIPFPTGTGVASIGVMDALRIANTTKFIRVTPPTGQKFEGFLTDEPIVLTTPGAYAFLYRAAGSSTIRGIYPMVSVVSPGFQPGYTGSAPISAGNIGEVLTSLTQVVTSVAGATGVLYDTGWSIPNVQPGVYRLDGSFIIATGGLGLTDLALIAFIATDGSNNTLSPINSYVSVTGYEQQIQAGHIGHPIQVTAVSTVKMRFRRISGVGSGTLTTLQQRGDLAGQHLTLTRIA